MQVTARVDYALRAMLAVAEQDEPTSTVLLAERLDISYTYLLSIVGELRRAGLLHVRRGSGGGLMLAKPSAEISLGDVIVAIDGPLMLPGDDLPGPRAEGRAEYLRKLWLAAHQAMLEVFARVPLTEARSSDLSVAATPAGLPGHTPQNQAAGVDQDTLDVAVT